VTEPPEFTEEEEQAFRRRYNMEAVFRRFNEGMRSLAEAIRASQEQERERLLEARATARQRAEEREARYQVWKARQEETNG
jgi:hypothetical protein